SSEGTGVIEGIVSGPSGPLSGALVAALPSDRSMLGDPEQASRAAATCRSAEDGTFHFESLKTGHYAVSATAPGLAAAFVGHLTVVADHPLSNIQLKLGPGENTFKGTLRDG